ncbi:MAG: hypothetical protein LH473_11425 [Chitinophagales bacterium]|nr:hypothetical protein [Chitinophagales bacterium]
MIALSKTDHDCNLKIHLDGARIFNALVELNAKPIEVGKHFDSISFCLSKGLGCPVGSLIVSNKEFIKKARKYRKIFGGGMRQAGFLAAAGIYALDHHVERLRDDHRKAKAIGETLSNTNYVEWLMPVETNIIIFKIKDSFSAEKFIAHLKENNILVMGIGKNQVRIVTHLDFNDDALTRVNETIKKNSL